MKKNLCIPFLGLLLAAMSCGPNQTELQECYSACENQRNAIIALFDQCMTDAFEAKTEGETMCRSQSSGEDLVACLNHVNENYSQAIRDCKQKRDESFLTLKGCEIRCYTREQPLPTKSN